MDELLHHTPTWRLNAERASRRDNLALNGSATTNNGIHPLPVNDVVRLQVFLVSMLAVFNCSKAISPNK